MFVALFSIKRPHGISWSLEAVSLEFDRRLNDSATDTFIKCHSNQAFLNIYMKGWERSGYCNVTKIPSDLSTGTECKGQLRAWIKYTQKACSILQKYQITFGWSYTQTAVINNIVMIPSRFCFLVFITSDIMISYYCIVCWYIVHVGIVLININTSLSKYIYIIVYWPLGDGAAHLLHILLIDICSISWQMATWTWLTLSWQWFP